MSILRSFKLGIYKTAKLFGLFRLSRRVTAHKLRILAYHGFAESDEVQFRDKLFISAKTFERRLVMLQKGRYSVLPLGQALQAFEAGSMKTGTVAITIDDGYVSTLRVAAPLLRALNMPATVYLTSYHMQTQTPVFDLMVAYLIWKAPPAQVLFAWPEGGQTFAYDLRAPSRRSVMLSTVIALGRGLGNEADRVELSRTLARALRLDYDGIAAKQAFRLMSPAEAQEIQRLGVDIGLHTHRHRFPTDDLATCRRELKDNLDYLQRTVGVSPQHFCYPSGVYSPCQWSVLKELGVASATTCDAGLVTPGDSHFGLRRFLDGESVSDIEFEAEISGFAGLVRDALGVDRLAPGAQRD